MEKIKYTSGYKYIIKEYANYQTGIKGLHVDTPFVKLSKQGWLWMREGYAWDGPSGPAIDTKTFMRASLIHDALYQLIRIGKLGKQYRIVADKEMYKICRQDGMFSVRAWYVYRAVRMFGFSAVKYKKTVHEAP